MDNLDEKSKSSFKVVDKRRFSSDGEAKSQDKSEAKSDAPVSKEEVHKEVVKEESSKKNEVSNKPEITYSLFIQSLAQQTFMALGLMPWPDSGLIQVKLEVAKETIDILGVISSKTTGNLNKDEEKLQTTLLYELRVAYMQVLQGNVDSGGPEIKKQ